MWQAVRALGVALGVLWIAPSLASAQYPQQQYDPRWSAPPWWQGDEQEEVAATAHRLSEISARLFQATRRAEGYSQLTDETQRLARSAERFHQIVESRAPYPRVMQAFEDLQRDYYELRGGFFRAHRTHHFEGIVAEWTRLVTSFERLALAMGVEESQLCTIPPQGYDRYGSYDPRLDDRRSYDPRFDRIPPGQRGLRFRVP